MTPSGNVGSLTSRWRLKCWVNVNLKSKKTSRLCVPAKTTAWVIIISQREYTLHRQVTSVGLWPLSRTSLWILLKCPVNIIVYRAGRQLCAPCDLCPSALYKPLNIGITCLSLWVGAEMLMIVTMRGRKPTLKIENEMCLALFDKRGL